MLVIYFHKVEWQCVLTPAARKAEEPYPKCVLLKGSMSSTGDDN